MDFLTTINNRLTLLTIRIAQQFKTLANRVAAVEASAVTIQVVDDRLNAIVGAAPAALDTLGELAAALADDNNAVAALTAQVASKVGSADLTAATNTLQAQIFDIVTVNNSQTPLSSFFDLTATVNQKASATDFLALNGTVVADGTRIGLIEAKMAAVGDTDYVALFETTLAA